MVFKLLEMSQLRWRRIDGYEKLKLIRAGAEFSDGIELNKVEEAAA